MPKGNRNGTLTYVPIVCSHDPLDYIMIMLGTNDMKFGKVPEDLVKPLKEKYIDYVRCDLAETLMTMPKFVIISPPRIEKDDEIYGGEKERSHRFCEVYRKLAEDSDCLFVDNEGVTVGPDGVHMNANGHKVLAKKIYKVLKADVKASKKKKQ